MYKLAAVPSFGRGAGEMAGIDEPLHFKVDLLDPRESDCGHFT